MFLNAKQLISLSIIQVSKAFSENIEIICIYCSKNCQLNADEILSYCDNQKAGFYPSTFSTAVFPQRFSFFKVWLAQ